MRTLPIIVLLSSAAMAETADKNKVIQTPQSPSMEISAEKALGVTAPEGELIVTNLGKVDQSENKQTPANSTEVRQESSVNPAADSTSNSTNDNQSQKSQQESKEESREEIKTKEEPISHFTVAQQNELKQIAAQMAKEYIEKNPESLINSIRSYGEEQQKAALAEEAKRYTQYKDELMDEKSAFVSGNKSGELKLIAFIEPNCGHCRNFEANLGELQSSFGDLKVYIRPLAIFVKGQNDKKDTPSEETVHYLGALKAHAPDRYEAIAREMATTPNEMNRKIFLEIAKKNGVDIKKLEDKKYEKDISKFISVNKNLAEKLKLEATPKIVLFDSNGAQMLESGEKEYLKKVLQEARQKKTEETTPDKLNKKPSSITPA